MMKEMATASWYFIERAGFSLISSVSRSPMSFAPGETYQYDWSHEVIVIN
jgi:hypothetical protein